MPKKKEETPKAYALYSDEEQTKLHALAYSEQQLKEITQQYTSGVWFEYDYEDDRYLYDERLYPKKVKFPKEVKKKEKKEDNNKDFSWIS